MDMALVLTRAFEMAVQIVDHFISAGGAFPNMYIVDHSHLRHPSAEHSFPRHFFYGTSSIRLAEPRVRSCRLDIVS
jgi:hypothetical protein